MRVRKISWLLLGALATGLLTASVGHTCIAEPGAAGTATAAGRLAKQASPVVLSDFDCTACFLLLHSPDAAAERAVRSPTQPVHGALAGCLVDGAAAQTVRQLPPSRAPPLLG